MKYLFFDLETTGLPERRVSTYGSYFPPREFAHYNECRVVTIAWIIYQDEQKLKESYYIVYPDGFVSSQRALEVHKITDEIAREKGIPLLQILKEFESDLVTCDQILSYNLEFDFNVLLAECWRYKVRTLIKRMKACDNCCIMIKSKTEIGIIGGVNKRYYKLEEVYRHLFGNKEFQTSHNALDDTRRCIDVFFKLQNPFYHLNAYQ
jgi:DNA polymerase III epsilon subunit-like protein